MKLYFCEDCMANHKCGIECHSRECCGEKCGCTARQIQTELYYCEICELVLPTRSDKPYPFEKYFISAKDWYHSFWTQKGEYLQDLEKEKFRGQELAQEDECLYNLVNSYQSLCQDFPQFMPTTLKLDTMDLRKKAYQFIQIVETLKREYPL